jgi:preprotein translocase subunit YajC
MQLLASLFADDAPKPDPAAGGPLGNPMFLMVVFVLFMVTMFWLPQRRQKKEQEAMLAALKPGAKVVTASGIIGTVIKLKEGEDEVSLRSDDTKLKVLRSSIVRVLGMDEEPKA